MNNKRLNINTVAANVIQPRSLMELNLSALITSKPPKPVLGVTSFQSPNAPDVLGDNRHSRNTLSTGTDSKNV